MEIETKKIEWEELSTAIVNLIQAQNKIFGWYNDEELSKTPGRIYRFYKEWAKDNNFTFTTFPVTDRDQMIIYDNIPFFSICSHHLLPFFGKVHIAYLPDQTVGGASKFSRLVKQKASKPTTQEVLTAEITDTLNEILQPRFIFVRAEARHLCQEMRGIRSVNETMKTSSLRFVDEVQNNISHLKEEARQ